MLKCLDLELLRIGILEEDFKTLREWNFYVYL